MKRDPTMNLKMDPQKLVRFQGILSKRTHFYYFSRDTDGSQSFVGINNELESEKGPDVEKGL